MRLRVGQVSATKTPIDQDACDKSAKIPLKPSTSQAYLRVRKLENIFISQIDQERVDTWRQKTYERKQPKDGSKNGQPKNKGRKVKFKVECNVIFPHGLRCWFSSSCTFRETAEVWHFRVRVVYVPRSFTSVSMSSCMPLCHSVMSTCKE